MSQSLAKILVHVIFSTKQRHPYLAPESRPELHRYMATVLKSLESTAIVINALDDHVHILYRLSKNGAICDVVQEIKTSTSKWLKTKGAGLEKFQWQSGYGAFSVSPSQAESVCRYIENQVVHHRKVSFQEEFRRFLVNCDVDFDERYVWD
jgi:REP element-mobilizing transposase RayT